MAFETEIDSICSVESYPRDGTTARPRHSFKMRSSIRIKACRRPRRNCGRLQIDPRCRTLYRGPKWMLRSCLYKAGPTHQAEGGSPFVMISSPSRDAENHMSQYWLDESVMDYPHLLLRPPDISPCHYIESS